MEELRHGVVDIGLITPIYVKGGAHLIRIQSGFYSGAASIESAGGAVSLHGRRATRSSHASCEGLKVLAVQGGSLPGIVTRDRPVRSLGDLQGHAHPRAHGTAERAARSGRRSGEHADGRRVLGAGQGRDRWRGRARRTPSGRCISSEVAKYYTRMRVSARRLSGAGHGHEALAVADASAARGAAKRASPCGSRRWPTRTAARSTKAGSSRRRPACVASDAVGASDQQRFDALYLREAERNAQSLDRYGIDGLKVFRIARASIGRGWPGHLPGEARNERRCSKASASRISAM